MSQLVKQEGALPAASEGLFSLSVRRLVWALCGARCRPSLAAIAWAWCGSVLGILSIAALEHFAVQGQGIPFLIGSFGASAVLCFAAPASPLAQPRNLLGGHVISALAGVTCVQLMPHALWLAAPIAVATAIALMQFSQTIHPPGGATALIAVIGGDSVHQLGYWYVLMPCLAGALLLLFFALVFNNLPRGRRWPEAWW
ncbi:MAG: HPP family protein [Desulfovibrionaceae bacterium]|nr:HPP family protein [Desulfovibrionaceae bacterium]